MFHKMNMSHIHLCIFCVICLIFISKWDPFRNKSYQRETILNKINRCLFTFLKMSSEHYLLAWVHVQCSSFLGLIPKKKGKKKREFPGFEPTPIFIQCFRGIRLVQSATEACYFNVKKNRLILVCLIYVTKHDQT